MASRMSKRYVVINMTTESFDKDYMKAINDPWTRKDNISDLNENLRRPLHDHHMLVNMYNDVLHQLADAKELVYQLTKERMSYDSEAWMDQ